MSSSSSFHPGNYSTAQQVVAYFAGAISGLLSVFGSAAVISYIVRRQGAILVKQNLKEQEPSDDEENKEQQKPPTQQGISGSTDPEIFCSSVSYDGAQLAASKRSRNGIKKRRRVLPSLMVELRLILLQSSCHLITGTVFIIWDVFVPRDFPDYWWNQGNAATCTLQGWVQQAAQISAAYYQVALASYYWWTMSFGLSDEHIQKKHLEWWIHIVALLWPLATATISIVLDVFHPSVILGCFYADRSLGCGEESNRSCTGGDHAYLFFWIFSGLPLVICFIFLCYVLVALYGYIRHLRELVHDEIPPDETAVLQHSESNNVYPNDISETGNAPTDSRAPVSARRERSTANKTRQEELRRAALLRFVAVEQDAVYTLSLYVVAFLLTHLTVFFGIFYDQTASTPPYAVRFLHDLLWPLQGFFNCWIFFRPRISQLRKHALEHGGDSMNFLKTAYRVIFFQHQSSPGKREKANESHNNNDTINTNNDAILHQHHLAMQPSVHAIAVKADTDTAAGSARSDSVGSSWTPQDVHNVRQLARAMSSRRQLSDKGTSSSMLAFHSTRLLVQTQSSSPETVPKSAVVGVGVGQITAASSAESKLESKSIAASAITGTRNGKPANPNGATNEKLLLAVAGVKEERRSRDGGGFEGDADSVSEMSHSESRLETSDHNLSSSLDTNTCHAIRRGSHFSGTSWAKLDLSQHADLVKPRIIAAFGPQPARRNSSECPDDCDTMSSFEGDAITEHASEHNRTNRRSSAGSGLDSIAEPYDDNDNNNQENQQDLHDHTERRGSGIPRNVRTSSPGEVLRHSSGSHSLGSWSSFSNSDFIVADVHPTENGNTVAAATTPSNAVIAMPSCDEGTGGMLSALPLQPGGKAISGLGSVMETEFEDSRADLSSSDLFGSEQEAPPRPLLWGGENEEYSSWSVISSSDVFSQPPPDMAGMIFKAAQSRVMVKTRQLPVDVEESQPNSCDLHVVEESDLEDTANAGQGECPVTVREAFADER